MIVPFICAIGGKGIFKDVLVGIEFILVVNANIKGKLS